MKRILSLLLLISTISFAQRERKIIIDADTSTRPPAGTYGIAARGNIQYLVPRTGNMIQITKSSDLKAKTITELRALATAQLWTNGTYTGIDGGVWIFDPNDNSSPDNTGTCLVTGAGKRLKRQIDGSTVFPEWWGAKADSLTDCSDAIRAALAYLKTRKGGVLQFNTGTYLVSKYHNTESSVTIRGISSSLYSFKSGEVGIELGKGTVIKVKQNGIMSGVPIFNLSGTSHVTIEHIDFICHGNNELYNTTKVIADSSANPGRSVTVRYCRSRFFGGEFVLLHGGGGVSYISHNRCNNHRASIIKFAGNADSWVTYNDLGGHQDNQTTGTQSACIELDGGANNTISYNYAYNTGWGIKLLNYSSYNRLTNNRCEKHSYAGFLFDLSSSNIVEGNQTFNNGYISDKAGYIIRNSSMYNQFHSNYAFVEAAYPGPVMVTGFDVSGSSSYNQFSGNYIKGVSGSGIKLVNCNHTSITNNTVFSVGEIGISIQNSCKNGIVSGNMIRRAGQAQNLTYDGIFLGNDCDNWQITENNIRADGITIYARSGIRISDSTCENNIVSDNDLFTAGSTANLQNIGTGTIVNNNRGYTTEAAGSATLLSANTSVVVTHGLALTPDITKIVLTPGSDIGTAGSIWVSAVTSTTFTVTSSAAPGADVTVRWVYRN